MQVSVEKKEGLEQKVTITIPYSEAEKAYKDSLKKVGKSVRIDGFRKGHIPDKILESRFGSDIISEAVDKLVNDTLFKALEEQKIDFVGRPAIDFDADPSKCFGDKTEFVYSAVVETEPEFELKPLSDLKLEKTVCEIGDADVAEMIEHLRTQQGKWQVKDGLVCAEGNQANVDFLGRIDGTPFEGGKAEGFSIHFGVSQMIPGFSEQIIGHKAGDKFTIKVTFPKEYGQRDLAGKEAEFDITVNNVSELIKPEVNADFLKIYGVKNGDLEGFKAELRRNMERELSYALHANNLEHVSEAVAADYKDLPVPKYYVEMEIEKLKNRTKQQLQMYGRSTNSLPDSLFKNEAFQAEAEKNSRLSLVFAKVAKEYEVSGPDEKYVDRQIELLAGAYEDKEQFVRNARQDKKMMASFRGRAFEEQLVDLIFSKAQVTENKVNFFDLVNDRF